MIFKGVKDVQRRCVTLFAPRVRSETVTVARQQTGRYAVHNNTPMWGDSHFTPVILSASDQCRGRDALELGPKAIVLIRTSQLPAWAQSTSYDRNEIHAGVDDEQVIGDMRQLLKNGNACIMHSQIRFMHADVSIADGVVNAAHETGVTRPPELTKMMARAASA